MGREGILQFGKVGAEFGEEVVSFDKGDFEI
jgi:hypothetical protein